MRLLHDETPLACSLLTGSEQSFVYRRCRVKQVDPGTFVEHTDFRKKEMQRLIRWPDSRCGQFHQVAIGIAEIQTMPATIPMNTALDRNALFA